MTVIVIIIIIIINTSNPTIGSYSYEQYNTFRFKYMHFSCCLISLFLYVSTQLANTIIY